MNFISIAQKSTGPKIDDFVPPIFIDSIVMANDLILGTDIKHVLNYQKEEWMPDIYKYNFKIRADGRLEPGTLETDFITIFEQYVSL